MGNKCKSRALRVMQDTSHVPLPHAALHAVAGAAAVNRTSWPAPSAAPQPPTPDRAQSFPAGTTAVYTIPRFSSFYTFETYIAAYSALYTVLAPVLYTQSEPSRRVAQQARRTRSHGVRDIYITTRSKLPHTLSKSHRHSSLTFYSAIIFSSSFAARPPNRHSKPTKPIKTA